MNGHGVASFRAQEENGQETMREVMRAVANRYPSGCGPEIFTSDNSCSEQDLLSNSFASARGGGAYSAATKGVLNLNACETHYVRNTSTLSAAEALLLQALAGNVMQFGLDLEWCSEQIPAVLQLAFQLPGSKKAQVIVVHLAALAYEHAPVQTANHQTIPARIAIPLQMLASKGAVFVGSQVTGDFTRLRNHYNFNSVPLVQQVNLRETWELHKGGGLDVASKQRAKGLIPDYKLATFCEVVLGKRLPKGRVRLSDWNTAVLTEPQIRYAALDAVASLRCHTGICSGQSCSNENVQSTTDLLIQAPSFGDADASPMVENQYPHLRRTEIKGDIWHFHDRAKRQLNDKMDPVSQMFSARLADCFLQTNAEDLSSVMRHLVESRGLSV